MSVFVLDGAMGTLLESWGVDFSVAGPMWSSSVLVSDPALVQRAHEAYSKAGCDIVLSCTYQMNANGCAAMGVTMPELVEKAMSVVSSSALRVAVDRTGSSVSASDLFGALAKAKAEAATVADGAALSADVQKRPALVCGSLGSYGSSLPGGEEYHCHYDVDEALVESFHAPRLTAFLPQSANSEGTTAAGGTPQVDLFQLETFAQLKEVQLIAAWVRRHRELPLPPLSFSFVASPMTEFFGGGSSEELNAWWTEKERAVHLPDGNTFEAALETLLTDDEATQLLVGFGCNCTGPLEVALAASSLLRLRCRPNAQQLALFLYPNSGETYANGVWTVPSQRHPGASSASASDQPLAGVELINALKMTLATGGGDVFTCAQLCCELLHQRELSSGAAADWQFNVIVTGACCRSTPHDIECIRKVVDIAAASS